MSDGGEFAFEGDIIPQGQRETDLAKVTEILLNEKWFRRKTILSLRVMATITTLDTIAQIYDIAWLRDWIRKYCEYLTSQEGKGRQDIVDITKYSIDKKAEHDKAMLEVLGRH
jgi:hypothetical protein